MAMRIPIRVPEHSSVVTPFMVKAFEYFPKVYFYIPVSPFNGRIWDGSDDGLIEFRLSPLDRKMVPWFISMLLGNVLTGFVSCLYVILGQLLHLGLTMEVPFFNLFAMCGATVGAPLAILACIVVYENPSLYDTANRMIVFERKCISALPPNLGRGRTRTDLLGLATFGADFGLSFAPIMMVVVGVAINLDPLYFILEDVLPICSQRPIWLTIAAITVRFLLACIWAAEFIRLTCQFSILMLLPEFIIIHTLRNLRHISGSSSLSLYQELGLLLGRVRRLVNDIAFLIALLIQSAMILLVWLIIKGESEVLSAYFTTALVIILVFLGVFSLLALKATASVSTEAEGLLRLKKNATYCGNSRVKRKFYYYAVWRAQQTLGIRCGPFVVIREDSTVAYLQQLQNNLINALMLI